MSISLAGLYILDYSKEQFFVKTFNFSFQRGRGFVEKKEWCNMYLKMISLKEVDGKPIKQQLLEDYPTSKFNNFKGQDYNRHKNDKIILYSDSY